MESDEEGVTLGSEVAAPDRCVSPNEEAMVARSSINTPPKRNLYRTGSGRTVKLADRLNL